MSYTKLMITDIQAEGDSDDPTEKTIKEFFETYSGATVHEDYKVKNREDQIILSESVKLFPFLIYPIEGLMNLAIDLSALRASMAAKAKEGPSFDQIRFSKDEKFLVDQYLPVMANEIIDLLQAYTNDIYDPLHLTSIWDDKDESGSLDGDEEKEEAYIFIFKFPETWPTSLKKTLHVTIRELLANHILAKYYEAIGYAEMYEQQMMVIQGSMTTLHSLAMRRTKPTRRKTNFFT